jgi:hypothetical protein
LLADEEPGAAAEILVDSGFLAVDAEPEAGLVVRVGAAPTAGTGAAEEAEERPAGVRAEVAKELPAAEPFIDSD